MNRKEEEQLKAALIKHIKKSRLLSCRADRNIEYRPDENGWFIAVSGEVATLTIQTKPIENIHTRKDG